MRQSKPYLLDDIGAELLLREPLEVADHLIDDRDGGLLEAELEPCGVRYPVHVAYRAEPANTKKTLTTVENQTPHKQ